MATMPDSDRALDAVDAALPDPAEAAAARAPFAPVVVAASSCGDVMLRWKSYAPAASAPVQRYLVQRFPNAQHRATWGTVLDANATHVVDRQVRAAHEYLYRVQAVYDHAQSAFAYHSVHLLSAGCAEATSLIAHLPSSLHGLAPLRHIDVLQAAAWICAFLLVIYGVVRASFMGVQTTLSRHSQLRRMRKTATRQKKRATAAAGGATHTAPTMRHSISSSAARSTASDSSTELSGTDQQTVSRHSSNAMESFRSLRLEDLTDANDEDDAAGPRPGRGLGPRAASDSLPSNPETSGYCTYCRKRFGIFRRRRVCSVCKSTALCRKCGFHGSADELRRSVIKLQAATGQRVSGKQIKTICRDCCAGAQRYSAAPSVRPSFPGAY